jgi:hypothetical protein
MEGPVTYFQTNKKVYAFYAAICCDLPCLAISTSHELTCCHQKLSESSMTGIWTLVIFRVECLKF